MSGQRKSVVWHLMKVAGLWFVVAQTATIAANSYKVPSTPFTYVAVAAFAVHSLLVMFDASSGEGNSGKLYSGAVTTLLVGGVIVMSLRITQSDDLEGVRKRAAFFLQDFSEWLAGGEEALRNMEAREHLAEAMRLIFQEGTRLSLTQAQVHLHRIPANCVEYASAQNLLAIAEARLAELEWGDALIGKRKSPIQVVSREQSNGLYRVTLRNNGSSTVKRIQYRVSYFRTTSGLQVSPDTEATVPKAIRPHDTFTLEISEEILKTPVHASFMVLDWETAG